MPVFSVPRTSTAPNHPTNRPCPMRPLNPHRMKPFYAHSPRPVRSQRITFYDLPFEIHLMIYGHVLGKDMQKMPYVDDYDDEAEEEEAMMAEVMESYLYGANQDESDMDDLAEDVEVGVGGLTMEELQEVHEMAMVGNLDDSDGDGGDEDMLGFDEVEAMEAEWQAQMETADAWAQAQGAIAELTESQMVADEETATSDLSESEHEVPGFIDVDADVDDESDLDGSESGVESSSDTGSDSNSQNDDVSDGGPGAFKLPPGDTFDEMMDNFVTDLIDKPTPSTPPEPLSPEATEELKEELLASLKALITHHPELGPACLRGFRKLLREKRKRAPPMNAFKILFEAQKRLNWEPWVLPERYLNTDDIWGQLSLLRASRHINHNFAPLLIPYLVRQTIELYGHEVKRQSPYTFDLIKSDLAGDRDATYARRNRRLLHWQHLSRQPTRAELEWDEYEQEAYKDGWLDFQGLPAGQTGMPWADIWQFVAMILTTCHDQSVMGHFLEGYVKGLKEYQGGRWFGWVRRDVISVLVEEVKMDPWVEDLLRKEFVIKGMRQRTLDEFVKKVETVKV
ncbi:hypothetical protein BJ508DRAFT_410659 [Ascobolus immersus RN42]|uniref:Uncharacterized protein n=1 Tax=Ascobolus immersus RN42 TaxID=1160509 RepID=A0A3N4ISB1_ASCIM|nr:hypothetical protein BJ508DRAFT_410659 [Ascobolus immersus RN42]